MAIWHCNFTNNRPPSLGHRVCVVRKSIYAIHHQYGMPALMQELRANLLWHMAVQWCSRKPQRVFLINASALLSDLSFILVPELGNPGLLSYEDGGWVVRMQAQRSEGPGFQSCPWLQVDNIQSSPSGLKVPTCCPDNCLLTQTPAKLQRGSSEAPGGRMSHTWWHH